MSSIIPGSVKQIMPYLSNLC